MARATFPRTITRGPLAGQYFTGQMEYMNARSRHLGFRSYADERQSKLNPFFQISYEAAKARGESREQAMSRAKNIIGNDRYRPVKKGSLGKGSDQGRRMSQMIQRMYAEGIYDPGDDVNESEFYE